MSSFRPLSTFTRRVAFAIAAVLAATLTAVFGLGAFTQASANTPSQKLTQAHDCSRAWGIR